MTILADAILDPEAWVKAGQNLSTWLSRDLGVKAGYLLGGILAFDGLLALIRAVKGR